MATLERAIEIACDAHAGQTDKAGEPYILHPLRVMARMGDPDARMAAVLHDTVEDGDYTLDSLRGEGFSEEVVAAVDCLTKRDGESYDDFITRVLPNPIARRVKLADIEDNMNLLRLARLTEKDVERLRRYHAARARLADALA